MGSNLILLSDSYKYCHHLQYPPGTTRIHSYYESRGGDFEEVVFFGLQMIIKKHFLKPVTQRDIEEASEIISLHLGNDRLFNRSGWEHILNDHDGKIPLRIRAVPEGSIIPCGNVLMTVENTCDRCFWVTSFFETALSQVWYPSTVATQSRECKKIIKWYLERTGDPGAADFKLHDFGFRGVSSVESAGMGGAAHLLNFRGTDTTEALLYAKNYYGEPMAGFSLPAAEHSTITSWGRENEVDAFRNMINQFGNGAPGIYAVVSDSYNIFLACDELWGDKLRDEVMIAPNTLVIRPDSGKLPDTVIEVLRILGHRFGCAVNSKGFKVLNKVRVIQGDGVDLGSIKMILGAMYQGGWSADNIAFGMGGALLQRLNRDTLKFAFKASAIKVSGEWRDVYKEPITDTGKNSKRGRLYLIRWDEGSYMTTRMNDHANDNARRKDVLQTVYENGELIMDEKFSDIRERAAV